jgi:hypothetical protein
VAQLDDVHSVLRLNYETLKGLISLASPSVAKPTHFETANDVGRLMVAVLMYNIHDSLREARLRPPPSSLATLSGVCRRGEGRLRYRNARVILDERCNI